MSVKTGDPAPKYDLSATIKKRWRPVLAFSCFAVAGYVFWLALQPVSDDSIKRFAQESQCQRQGLVLRLDRDKVVTGEAMFFIGVKCEKEQKEKDRKSVIARQSNALHH